MSCFPINGSKKICAQSFDPMGNNKISISSVNNERTV